MGGVGRRTGNNGCEQTDACPDSGVHWLHLRFLVKPPAMRLSPHPVGVRCCMHQAATGCTALLLPEGEYVTSNWSMGLESTHSDTCPAC